MSLRRLPGARKRLVAYLPECLGTHKLAPEDLGSARADRSVGCASGAAHTPGRLLERGATKPGYHTTSVLPPERAMPGLPTPAQRSSGSPAHVQVGILQYWQQGRRNARVAAGAKGSATALRTLGSSSLSARRSSTEAASPPI